MDSKLGDPNARGQSDWTVPVVDELKGEAAAKAGMDEDRRSDDQPDSSPRRPSDDIGTHVIRQPQILKGCCEYEVGRMKPKLTTKWHHNPVVHFVDVDLFVGFWI